MMGLQSVDDGQESSVPLANRESKKVYIEFLRIIASYFVIFNHTTIDGYFLFSLFPDNSIQYWLYLIMSIFCKFSVPLFLAISGSLLLPRNETLGYIYKKRILKICVVLFLFSVVYFLDCVIKDLCDFSLRHFLKLLYTAEWMYHLWYLYLFISFLVILPFMRTLVQNLEKVYFYYLFAFALFFLGFLPIIEYLLWQGKYTLNDNLKIGWMTTSYILYPCLGYFLEHKIDIKMAKKWILPLWLINILTILIACVMTFYRARVMGICDEGNSQAFHMSFVFVNVTTLFITAKYFFTTHTISQTVTNAICLLGGTAFGIYLLHVLFLSSPLVNNLWILLRDTLNINPMISAFIVCLIVQVVCCVITLIAKRMPVLKKLI